MSYRACLVLFALFWGLPGCSQLQQTGRAVADGNGVLQDSSERHLGGRKYKIRVQGSTVVFNGQAEQLFRRYHRARSDPAAMRSLIDESRRCAA